MCSCSHSHLYSSFTALLFTVHNVCLGLFTNPWYQINQCINIHTYIYIHTYIFIYIQTLFVRFRWGFTECCTRPWSCPGFYCCHGCGECGFGWDAGTGMRTQESCQSIVFRFLPCLCYHSFSFYGYTFFVCGRVYSGFILSYSFFNLPMESHYIKLYDTDDIFNSSCS